MEFLPIRKARNLIRRKIIWIATAAAIILVTAICVSNPQYASPPPKSPSMAPPAQEACDIFSGDWIPDPEAPYYTNKTCWAIHDHQNCMKYGRPDSDFIKWRWKPDGCELPLFNPYQFLDIVRGKSLAFVGDSVARNQMQSIICLLSRVEYPIDMSPPTTDKHWKYVNYNFTMSYFWSPFLVRSGVRDDVGPTNIGLFNLYLDELDESWTDQIHGFDYLIINAGHWFNRNTVYYESRRVVGCRYCLLPNITDLPATYAYRRAFRTAFRALENFAGVTLMRTFAPAHFEGGEWNAGGDCVRRRPLWSNGTVLDGQTLDMHAAQLEEFRAAMGRGNRGVRVMDVTKMMLLRPDGHPSRYGHWAQEKVVLYNDCVHWCLPGPIDSWADILLHLLNMEARR
ncbi:protein trichome birefringence-like 19 [Salvia hispanica]|uniref:protein trichome birefringence-like 19 n=1 Tax=Salvia hispanica TaxID=49212 RepID=UPI002009B208|nr:protein trichome birefringence-like 19 [Salvia hispanica]